MSKFIGIDIAKKTFEAAFLKTGAVNGYENNLSGFKKLIRKLEPDSVVVMEASGPYYLRLAYFLHEHQVKIAVVNPLSIRRFCQMRMTRAKTDKKDAVMIALYGQQESPELWRPDDAVILKLQQINMALQGLDKQRTAMNNQMEAVRQLPVQDKEVIKTFKKMMSALKKEQQKLEAHMEELVLEHYNSTYKALRTIPGIGPKAAVMLIAITNNFKNFDHYKQLIAYAGLSPRIFQSGTSVKGKGHICKMGMGRLRKILYMCSWSAKRFNIYCKQMYERLAAKGKPERVIKIAIANKLIRQAFAVATKLTAFDKNYHNKLAF